MAKTISTPDGRTIYLMNPAERRAKYVRELQTGTDMFSGRPLTERQKAYRAGYMQSSQDNTKAFKHNKAKGKIKEITHNKKKGLFHIFGD